VDAASELPPELELAPELELPPELVPPLSRLPPSNWKPPSGMQNPPAPKPVILQVPEAQSELALHSWKPPEHGAAAHDALKPPKPPPPVMLPQHTWPPEQLDVPVQLMANPADPSGHDAMHDPVGIPPAPPPEKQHVSPDGHVMPPEPHAPPPSVNVVTAPEEAPEDDAPEEPPELAPLLFPLPPSSPLPLLFDVDPPHAAASARPTETENQTVVFFMAKVPLQT
jgi:hypothetical protein